MPTNQLTAAMAALDSLSTRDLEDLIDLLDDQLGDDDVRHRRCGKAPLHVARSKAGDALLGVLDASAELDEDGLVTLIQAGRLLQRALQPVEERIKRPDEKGELVPVAQGTVQTKRIRRKVLDPHTGRQVWNSYGPYLYIRTYASGGGREKNETRLNNTYLGYLELAEVFEDLPRHAPERQVLRGEILEGHKNHTLDDVCARWVSRRLELLLKYPTSSKEPSVKETHSGNDDPQPQTTEQQLDVSHPPTPGYQLRVELLEISPTIWRRFTVPAGISFENFHDIVQIVMGWQNDHLYRFEVGGGALIRNPQGPGDRYSGELIDGYLQYPGAEFFYEYDFGDLWGHLLVLEKQLSSPVLAPQCTAGACACPPEDCGGPWLYDEFLHARKKRKGKVSPKWQPRIGNYWDADAFDKKQINRDLVEYWQSIMQKSE